MMCAMMTSLDTDFCAKGVEAWNNLDSGCVRCFWSLVLLLQLILWELVCVFDNIQRKFLVRFKKIIFSGLLLVTFEKIKPQRLQRQTFSFDYHHQHWKHYHHSICTYFTISIGNFIFVFSFLFEIVFYFHHQYRKHHHHCICICICILPSPSESEPSPPPTLSTFFNCHHHCQYC